MSIFNQTLAMKPKRNVFDLSHDRKLSFQMGQLVPIMCSEVLPGDTFKLTSQQLLRFAPMVAPIMHKVNVYTHFFFVPNRLLWSSWEDFITGGEDGLAAPVAPYINMTSCTNGSVADYLGLGLFTGITAQQISALPVAAYLKCFEDYYKDQNVGTEYPFELVDGEQTDGQFVAVMNGAPILRNWQHDYFTSCLPEPQKGPSVTLPLGETADIDFVNTGTPSVIREMDGTTHLQDEQLKSSVAANLTGVTSGLGLAMDNSAQLIVDLSTATAASINDLRRAIKLQEFLELNARGGSRYIENIRAHFGVNSSDSRLQRAEYLGGGKSNVVFSEVLNQTGSSAEGSSPLGDMAGHGINAGSSHQFSRFFEEHGFIIGIMSVMPETAYFQGIPKFFQRNDKLDYYWPSFAHIGEQEVLNKELYANHTTPEGVFGYIPRYAEYKYCNSTVHGDFRSNLKHWHMAREFASSPNLNNDFIMSDPTYRIFAVQSPVVDKMYCHVFNQVKAIRPMPIFGIPKIA